MFRNEGQWVFRDVTQAVGLHHRRFSMAAAWEARQMAIDMGFKGKEINKLSGFFMRLWKIVSNYDVELTEINPLILTKDGRFLAADARLNIDDNALYRHKDIIEKIQRAPVEQNERERMATAEGMAYIELEGNIACICNGAGLTMATLDAVELYGGKASTFLAFFLICSDHPNDHRNK